MEGELIIGSIHRNPNTELECSILYDTSSNNIPMLDK